MDKKDREWDCLQSFSKCFPEFPQGRMVPTENPDFLVHTQNGILGIELTLLHRETPDAKHPMQEQEVLGRQVLQKASELYDQKHLPPIHMSVHFNPQYRLVKLEVPDTARAVLDLVLATGTSSRFELKETEENTEHWPQQIARIVGLRNPSLTKRTWSPTDAGCVPDLHPDLVQMVISRKNRRVQDYRRRCTEIWLLLVADGFGISSTVTVTHHVTRHNYDSEFDRIFLFQRFDRQFHELLKATTR